MTDSVGPPQVPCTSPTHEQEIRHIQRIARKKLPRRALLEVLPLPAGFAAIVGVFLAAGAPASLWAWAAVGLCLYGGLGAWAAAGRHA